ncbi:MAG: hypothetical protein H0V29_09470 [Thermoleophilaceae bacterium]|nr:hypothetical protein [Thermoleophilaceae bacterium]
MALPSAAFGAVKDTKIVSPPGGNPNGPVRDVYLWNFPRERLKGNVSRESRYAGVPRALQAFNGASIKPSTSARGNYFGFTGLFTGVGGEANGPGIADAFMRFGGGSDEGFTTD